MADVSDPAIREAIEDVRVCSVFARLSPVLLCALCSPPLNGLSRGHLHHITSFSLFFLTFPSSSTAQSLLVVVLCVLLGLLTNHLRLYGVLIAAAARVWRCKACTTTVTMLLFYILIKNYLHIKGWRKKKSSNISISNLLAPPQQSSNSALASITQWISVVKHVLCAPPLQSDGLSTERKE